MTREKRIKANRQRVLRQRKFPWADNKKYRSEVLPPQKLYKASKHINYIDKCADANYTDSRIGEPFLYGS